MPTQAKVPWMPVGALLLAATFWGLLWYPLRELALRGLHGLWSTWTLFAAAALLGLPLLWRQRAYLRRRPLLLPAVALSSAWCNIAFVLAVLEGTVLRVMLLFYLSPVWAALLGRVILGEAVPVRGWLAVAAALGGAVAMLWDSEVGLPWPREAADWLALSSGLAFALANVLLRKLEDVPVALKTAVSWWGVVVLAAVIALATGTTPPRAPLEVWAAAAALGALGIVTMTLAVVYGVSHMPVHRSAVILLFEVVVGAVSAAWLAGEGLSGREWLGGAVILAAAWLAAAGKKQQ